MLKISPHPLAPIFSLDSNPNLVLDQIISEVESGNFSTGEKFREYFRQAGFVNLWIFAKLIAGYNGPFDRLNTDLHVEMTNFFQDSVERRGKSAAFLGRGLFKSTAFTRAGIPWTALRDPDIKWVLFSAIHERSVQSFMWVMQRIFDSNELFAWLYPEYVPPKNSKRWNDEEMCLPNRTRHQPEPTVLPRGVCCSSQGLHGNLFIDDPIGDNQLNANRQSSADMYKIGNWLKSNLKTLLSGVVDPIVFYTATRYAVDDAHTFIFDDIREMRGVWDDDDRSHYQVRSDGEWVVYNRYTMENGHSIAPEIISDTELVKMAKDDPWTFATEFQNKPRESGLSELNLYELKECELGWDEEDGWTITYGKDGRWRTIKLSSCDVVQAVDPGATEKYVSAKTSRSAVGVLARSADDEAFLITCRADFVKTSIVFDWMFANGKKFYNYLRMSALETQGAFKILDPNLKEEIVRRQKECLARKEKFCPIHHKAVTKTGGKIEVIRNTLEPLLQRGLLYVEKSIKPLVWDELVSFPQSKKMDILDMIALAWSSTYRPESEDEAEERVKREDEFDRRTANAAGY